MTNSGAYRILPRQANDDRPTSKCQQTIGPATCNQPATHVCIHNDQTIMTACWVHAKLWAEDNSRPFNRHSFDFILPRQAEEAEPETHEPKPETIPSLTAAEIAELKAKTRTTNPRRTRSNKNQEPGQ